MLNEAVRALVDDKIVEKAEEVDLAMIMGTGFPPFKGGLMKYADSIGTRKITDELLRFADDVGPRVKPAESLMKMADGNEKFYDKF